MSCKAVPQCEKGREVPAQRGSTSLALERTENTPLYPKSPLLKAGSAALLCRGCSAWCPWGLRKHLWRPRESLPVSLQPSSAIQRSGRPIWCSWSFQNKVKQGRGWQVWCDVNVSQLLSMATLPPVKRYLKCASLHFFPKKETSAISCHGRSLPSYSLHPVP